jgi:flagellar basal body-associated protein FliL
MFGNTLLYSNAQSYGNGATAYNYIYAAKVGTDAEIKARNKKYNAVVGTDEDDKGYIAEYDENADLGKAMRYFFRTGAKGESSLFEAVRNEYTKYQKEQYDVFVALFEEGAEGQLSLESEFIRQVGAMKASDAEAIAESWKNYLRQPDPVEEKEEKGLSTAVIIIIVAAIVLVVAAGVLVPVIILHKKKVARRKEAEATVNAYKRKRVDTTDDKTIDVYADDEPAEEATEEAVEEVVEETVEEAVEAVEETVEETAEVAEETTEAPVEEKTEE